MRPCKNAKSALVACILVASALPLAGCGDDDDPTGVQPEALVGDWAEVGYERRMILQASGDFLYITSSAATDKAQEGGGTWQATADRLTLNLLFGQFRWAESSNNAPLSFSFDYVVEADTLALTFVVMGETTRTRYARLD